MILHTGSNPVLTTKIKDMPDIAKCEGGNCPLKNKCYRYISADSMRQSYFIEPPYIDDQCDYFWDIDSNEQIEN